jgi:hypothetical protein
MILMKGNFDKTRKVFSMQLVMQLKAWQAAGEKIILFIDVNKKIALHPLHEHSGERDY